MATIQQVSAAITACECIHKLTRKLSRTFPRVNVLQFSPTPWRGRHDAQRSRATRPGMLRDDA